MQYAEVENSHPAGKEAQKHVQKVNGKFLWCARAVDGVLLALSVH